MQIFPILESQDQTVDMPSPTQTGEIADGGQPFC